MVGLIGQGLGRRKVRKRQKMSEEETCELTHKHRHEV